MGLESGSSAERIADRKRTDVGLDSGSSHKTRSRVEGIDVGAHAGSTDGGTGGEGIEVVGGGGINFGKGGFIRGGRGSGHGSGGNGGSRSASEGIEVRRSVARSGGGGRGGRDRVSPTEGFQVAEGEGRSQDRSQNSAGKKDIHFGMYWCCREDGSKRKIVTRSEL